MFQSTILLLFTCAWICSASLWAGSDDDNYERMRNLLVHGMDANVAPPGEAFAIIGAAASRNNRAVDLLLRYGAFVDVVEADGWTALMFGAYQGNIASMDMLLKKGADPFLQNNFGKNALDIAMDEMQLEAYEFLANAAVVFAVSSQNPHLVVKALHYNGDVNMFNDMGFTPVLFFCSLGEVELVQRLIDHYKQGLNINAVENDGWGCLDFALAREDYPMITILKLAGAVSHKQFEAHRGVDMHFPAMSMDAAGDMLQWTGDHTNVQGSTTHHSMRGSERRQQW